MIEVNQSDRRGKNHIIKERKSFPWETHVTLCQLDHLDGDTEEYDDVDEIPKLCQHCERIFKEQQED